MTLLIVEFWTSNVTMFPDRSNEFDEYSVFLTDRNGGLTLEIRSVLINLNNPLNGGRAVAIVNRDHVGLKGTRMDLKWP